MIKRIINYIRNLFKRKPKEVNFLKMKVAKKRYLKVVGVNKNNCHKYPIFNLFLQAESGIILSTSRVKISSDKYKGLYQYPSAGQKYPGVYYLLKFYNKKSIHDLTEEMVLVGEDEKGFIIVLAYDPDKLNQ